MEYEDDDNVFVPQVSHTSKPKIGLEFDSHEDAQSFYNQYAREAGFSTRVGNCKKNKSTGEYGWKLFVCSKEGKTDETYQTRHKYDVERTGERKCGQTQCGCNARMAVVKQQNGQGWAVSKFIEEHNHALTTPSRVHLLRSHRQVTATKKALVNQFSEANIPTCQQVRLLEIDAGGPSAVGCEERDIRNHERDLRREKLGHDAEALIEDFLLEKEKNPNFFFDYQTDEEDKFVRCFWADCESRRSYAYFGDVVVFDTTYNTNKYAMILAPFVGVNNHRQTVLFGCGLLSDETTESFAWLFSKFLEAMPNHVPPRVIITDQDVAIAKGISMVFPLTFHRFCLWHILNKFPEKMNVMHYTQHYHTLVTIVRDSEMPEEFDERWIAVVDSSELRSNEWLIQMFHIRSRWVPAYVKHVFAAGMSSNQRAESSHSFLKKYVSRNNTLLNFITRFNRALVHQRHEELAANHVDMNEKPRLTTTHPMEHQMVQVYTKKIFLLFQKELEESNFYTCSKTANFGDNKVYVVQRFEVGKTFDRHRQLNYSTSTDFITCSCRTFEYEGYPCRHMISFLKKKQVMTLPEKYILLRWTKNAKLAPVFDTLPSYGHEGGSSQSWMSRHGILAHSASELVDMGSLTDERSNFLLCEFKNLKLRVSDLNDGGSVGISRTRSRSREETPVISDPNPVRAKGCGKRIKSRKEKLMSQPTRQCSVCGLTGHDKRTCPTLVNRSNSVGESYHPQYHYDNTQDEAYQPQFSYENTQDDMFTSIHNSKFGFAPTYYGDHGE